MIIVHKLDEKNYCQEGVEPGVEEMLTNGNVGVDSDENFVTIIQNGECNDNVENIRNKTNEDGKTIKQQLQSENVKLVPLNVGPDAVEDENKCTVT